MCFFFVGHGYFWHDEKRYRGELNVPKVLKFK